MDLEEVNLINSLLKDSAIEVTTKISEGSYGEVYAARCLVKGTLYALKLMEPDKLRAKGKLHESFIEILVLQRLSHPGIIKLNQVIEKPSLLGLVLEYCPYGDLFSFIGLMHRKMELLSRKRHIMRYLLAQLVYSLEYLHFEGVVHRDLKPQNVVIGLDCRLRIIDFSTASVRNPNILTTQEMEKVAQMKADCNSQDQKMRKMSLVGTANFLSPESTHLQYSEKSDIWSFGIICYKFVYNRLPFLGQNFAEVVSRIRECKVQFDLGIDEDVKEIIEACLDPDPEKRPSAAKIKTFRFFKEVNFTTIFEVPSLIKDEDFKQFDVSQQEECCLFEKQVEKKMFFGNFKPRLLTIDRKGTNLLMSYRYIETRCAKNTIELRINDYVEAISRMQFEFSVGDKKLIFRVSVSQLSAIISGINTAIVKHFELNH